MYLVLQHVNKISSLRKHTRTRIHFKCIKTTYLNVECFKYVRKDKTWLVVFAEVLDST